MDHADVKAFGEALGLFRTQAGLDSAGFSRQTWHEPKISSRLGSWDKPAENQRRGTSNRQYFRVKR